MKENETRFTLRIDRSLFNKFKYIADYNGRSANRELEHFIKRLVQSFEREHGAIPDEYIKDDKE